MEQIPRISNCDEPPTHGCNKVIVNGRWMFLEDTMGNNERLPMLKCCSNKNHSKHIQKTSICDDLDLTYGHCINICNILCLNSHKSSHKKLNFDFNMPHVT